MCFCRHILNFAHRHEQMLSRPGYIMHCNVQRRNLAFARGKWISWISCIYISDWASCLATKIWPASLSLCFHRLSIQTWQSDMVKALQEIEQYCYTSENFYIYLSVITLITYSCIAGKYIILNVYFLIVLILFLYCRMTTAKIMPRLLF
jgi:hypothetical protein